MRQALPPTRRGRLRVTVVIVALLLVTPSAVSAATYDGEQSAIQRGTITQPADGLTVVAVQGFKHQDRGSIKKPARLVAFGPRGEVRWVYNGSNVGASWFYDVDPLPSGNLLVTAAHPQGTVVLGLDPATQEPVWVEHLSIHDTHDIDYLPGNRLLVANMRQYNESTERNNDRLLVYNMTTDRVEWEWLFREHYPRTGGGKYSDDWTHVNDIDRIAPGKYLASVRNFDQVIVVDRESGEITQRLGRDDAHDIIYEQHNPQYLEGEDGRPAMLVADSENNRIVEYEKRDGDWTETWKLTGGLSWPRDADRLPNGHTLIVDSLNHRVMEVTPTGRIVWEVYAPWGPYDAERVQLGDEPGGPTIAEQGASGTHTLSGSAGLVPGTGGRSTFAGQLTATFAGTPIDGQVRWFATRWAHVTPWIYPVWMTGWDFAGLILAALLLLMWLLAELVIERQRFVERIRRHVP